jgi:hypothetical protein
MEVPLKGKRIPRVWVKEAEGGIRNELEARGVMERALAGVVRKYQL